MLHSSAGSCVRQKRTSIAKQLLREWVDLKTAATPRFRSRPCIWQTPSLVPGASLQGSPVCPEPQAALAPNTDSLALPETEFDRMWPTVVHLANSIADERCPASELLRFLSQTSLPPGWANIVRVLLAEGLLRRRAIDAIPEVIAGVSSKALQELWGRWYQRTERA